MNTLTKTLAIVALTAATTIAPFASAQADSWNSHQFGGRNLREEGQPQNNQWQYRHNRHGYRYHDVRRNNNDAIALGVLGLAAGAIIGGAIADSHRNYEQPRVYNAPRGIEYSGDIEPWTPAWYRYCDNRYRSFNDRTGTYRGYDGRDHFCVAN